MRHETDPQCQAFVYPGLPVFDCTAVDSDLFCWCQTPCWYPGNEVCLSSAMARGIIPLVGVKLLLESGVIVEELVFSVPESDYQA